MSCIIGLHLGEHVMLATDHRFSDFNASGSKMWHRDVPFGKIRLGPRSVITGSGFVPLMRIVEDRIMDEGPADLQAILDIIGEERHIVSSTPRLSDYEIDHGLRKTGWMLSFEATVDGTPTMILAVYHPAHGHAFDLFGADSCVAFIPNDGAEELEAEIGSRLHGELRLAMTDSRASVAHHAELLREAMRRVARKLDTVSPTCTIAVHRLKKRPRILARTT